MQGTYTTQTSIARLDLDLQNFRQGDDQISSQRERVVSGTTSLRQSYRQAPSVNCFQVALTLTGRTCQAPFSTRWSCPTQRKCSSEMLEISERVGWPQPSGTFKFTFRFNRTETLANHLWPSHSVCWVRNKVIFSILFPHSQILQEGPPKKANSNGAV